MAERMFGMEREYALTPLNPGGTPLERAEAIARLGRLAKTRLKHLPGMGHLDLFLENGARLYVDCGYHPEFCTPECVNPWDVVRYSEAGEAILAGLAADLERGSGIREMAIFKCNVDYSGTRHTWGCHESYRCVGFRTRSSRTWSHGSFTRGQGDSMPAPAVWRSRSHPGSPTSCGVYRATAQVTEGSSTPRTSR